MMNRFVTILALVPLLVACSGKSGGGPAPAVYHFADHYWYVPPGYRAVCENRQMVVTTPEGQTLRGQEGTQALQSVANRAKVKQADQVTGKPVFGVSRTSCRNGYGRWGYPPTFSGPEDPRNGVRSECDRLTGPARGALGPVTGSVGVPPARCSGAF